ncbi:MAG: hypothetical protein ACYTFK_09435 [Planctomycetota bacterium]|jgi:hypothetical protein
MNRRKYFLASLLLAVCAICSDFVWKEYAMRSHSLYAESFGMFKGHQDVVRTRAQELLEKGTFFFRIGLGFASLSFLLWLVSLARHEPAWQSIPFLLLIFYLLLNLLAVSLNR